MPEKNGAQSFSISINGKRLADEVGVLELLVTNLVNTIPKAKIKIKDGSAAAQNFDLSNGDNFIPGAEISIAAGNGGENEIIFSGLIISQTIMADADGSYMEIECRDKSIKLTAGRKNKVFENTTDADAIVGILEGSDIETEISGLDTERKQLVQFNSSNWDFLVTRAELNGALVIAEQGKLKIAPPDVTQQVLSTYTYGIGIYDFEAKMDARTQFPKVLTKSWSFTDQDVQEMESSNVSLPDQGNLSGDDLSSVLGWEENTLFHSGEIEPQESTQWANAELFRSRLNRIVGNFRVIGDSRLKPGIVVELLGIGDRFSGTCLVTGVVHSYSNEAAWYSHVQFGLDKTLHNYKYDDVADKPAAGLVPPVNGLQIAIVTQIQDDPDGENRIRVKIPLVDNQGDGIWARLVSLDAGNNRGWVWYPEVGDEVIIGFINDDPRNAIILGSLYSSAQPAPLIADEENKQKGLLSKSGLSLLFDDDKKIIKISTKAGNVITLDEDQQSLTIQDQNNNIIEMSSSAIKIESAGDLNIKASGDIKIEGMNISTTANAQLKQSGSGGVELSSSAITKIKGSLVQIN